jgi:glycosyltransferase involved in cell wall biosynthesis
LKKLSIVIPLYNEQDIIDELHSRLVKVCDALLRQYEIVYSNDGSTDTTLMKLKAILRREEVYGHGLDNASFARDVVIVDLAKNYGQTGALASGIDYATGDIIITMDGDLQHEPELIPIFLKKIEEGYDIVSGWREVREDNFLLRKLPSSSANKIARWITGIPIRDFGSTYKAYRSELLKKIELFGELHRFIPVLAHRMGAKTVEIPIRVKERKAGSSKYGIGRTFGVLQDLIFLEFYSNYLTKPIRAFGNLFILFFSAGFFIASVLMGLWCIGTIKAVLDHGALLLFSVFLMIVGVQLLVTGVLAEILIRIYFKVSDSKIYTVRNIYRSKEVTTDVELNRFKEVKNL